MQYPAQTLANRAPLKVSGDEEVKLPYVSDQRFIVDNQVQQQDNIARLQQRPSTAADSVRVNILSTLNEPLEGEAASLRIKKDALWKPLLRGFRSYLRRALENYLDISLIYDGSGDLSRTT